MIYSKYKYIAAVAELRSISKAAQKLYISQPALTRIVMNIEEELGTPLFNRAALPIQLTYAGERYLEEARRVLAIDSSLRRELQEISEMKRGLLKIGTNYAASNLWLPHILPVFRREAYIPVTAGIPLRQIAGKLLQRPRGILPDAAGIELDKMILGQMVIVEPALHRAVGLIKKDLVLRL